MNDAVIIDCCRTPIGRSHENYGWFRDVRSDDLAVACVRSLVERTGLDPREVEDVVMGCARQRLEQGFNVARFIALMAGLPYTTPGTTVNRLCGSSLQAIHQASHALMAGCADVQIVGGLEHMQHLPLGQGIDINPRLYRHTSKNALMMGQTAEFLARTHGITRAEQDRFALRSHRHAAAAQQRGDFAREIIPLHGRDEEGSRFLVTQDQCVRPDADPDALAALQPVFLPDNGTVTAGNSSPVNDGAAALLMMSSDKAKQLGLEPLVRVRSTAVVGVEPALMGTAPVPATEKVLRRAGLVIGDIDLIELNEAFAAQALACVRLLDLDENKVNIRGGSIAIGHPLGASGARIATTLIHTMLDHDATLGLATMCIGGGQGIAAVLERV